jgi:hypothetical protein
MKVLQMNLISLLKPHQSTNVMVLVILSLNFLTIIRFQICAISLAQLTKNIYKLINHHIAFIKIMHTHWMTLLKCIITKAKGKYHIALDSFFVNLIKLMHGHNKFTIMQYRQSY